MKSGNQSDPNRSHQTEKANQKCSQVSIIIPTYQEGENLEELINRIDQAMDSLKSKYSYESIIVDDNSQDNTPEIIAKLQEQKFPVRLIVRKDQRGLSSAVIRGLQEASGQVLVCMDADLSHPPAAVPKLIKCIVEEKADFVIGSRYVKGGSTDDSWGIFRWLNSKFATLLARPFTKAKDPMAGFFALSKPTFDSASKLNPIGYKIGLELIVKCHCQRIAEVPIHFADRKHGESKLCLKEQLNYLKHIKRLGEYKFGRYFQFLQFCGVGATGMAVDLSIYYGLLCLSFPTAAGRALAIWIAMSWNFAGNRLVTFQSSRKSPILQQYFRFVLSCGIGAVLSWSISTGLSEFTTYFNEHKMLSAIIGIVVGTVSNFILSCFWVFGSKDHDTEKVGKKSNP